MATTEKAKSEPKRLDESAVVKAKSGLDTLIEVLQKELADPDRKRSSEKIRMDLDAAIQKLGVLSREYKSEFPKLF